MLQRARALFLLGEPGLDLLTEAIGKFRAAGDAEGAAEAATLAARFSWFVGDRSATDRYIAEALDAVADRPDSRAKAEALTNQSGFHMLAARYDEAIQVAAEALPRVEALEMEEQRARLHIVVGTARWGLGDPGGLDEIEDGISIADAAGALEMVTVGYDNLSSGFNCFGRLADGRRALRQVVEHGERYGLARVLRGGRQQAAGWDYVDGRWNEAIAVADELVAAADAGDRHFTDASILSLRAWIRLGRGDPVGADRDSERAVELARASDIQAQSCAYTIRAAVVLAARKRSEAEALASELATQGAGIVGALNTAFPTLADVAWVFRDLGREEEFAAAVLDAEPIDGPWKDASRAIVEGDLVQAAETIDGMGHPAGAAYARLRAAEALATARLEAESAAQRGAAEAFYGKVGATRFLRDLEAIGAASQASRRASSHR